MPYVGGDIIFRIGMLTRFLQYPDNKYKSTTFFIFYTSFRTNIFELILGVDPAGIELLQPVLVRIEQQIKC